jgi:hypothetical protein
MLAKVEAPIEEGMKKILNYWMGKWSLNITKAMPKEVLPPCFSHGYAGFVLKENKWTI